MFNSIALEAEIIQMLDGETSRPERLELKSHLKCWKKLEQEIKSSKEFFFANSSRRLSGIIKFQINFRLEITKKLSLQ